jgi:hypothetical protein
MKQEQLKIALCGYLPYEVYIQYEGILNGKERENYRKEWTKRNQDKTEILDIEPYDIPNEVVGLKIAPLKRITQYKKFWLAEAGIKQYKKFYNGRDCKPVLFNISCLTKPIIVKGYNGGLPFVPVIELCKNIFGDSYSSDNYDELELNDLENQMIMLCSDLDLITLNQSDLLNRWKIDYRNLIGQGLAIDVETLKKNCYE